ncbi:alpha/beta hydrolase [Chryseobacterium vaccae]|uniref:alpha/beta hydrolase n=1 Tax=Chryseobacterium vaccae TaxID=2604424 RepID=UPI0012955FC3|nr:alpha/beta hydrolase [Chryseobacterium vaccae]
MKKNFKVTLLCLLAFFLWTGCKEKKVTLGKGADFNKEQNIHYGDDPEKIMDLYIPEKKSTKEREVFIIIHGGGWRAGDKSQLTFFTLSLMQKFPDHIFVNMNYRLASQERYALPNQISDIKDVAVFLEKKLRYNPKLILLGNSAGGHLSMLYAYQTDIQKKVKAVINIVGPTALSDPGFKKYQEYSFVERRLVDPRVPKSGISRIAYASPVHWIDSASAPTLSYYGNTDHVVPLSQKRILDSVLSKHHVRHESYEFNGGHLDWDKAPNNVFLINAIDQFLKQPEKK